MTHRHDTLPRLARLAVCAIAIAAALGACASKKPPTDTLAASKAALTAAADAGAIDLAPAEMQAAEDKAYRARAALVAGDYDTARQLSEQAEVDARLAAVKARSAKTQRVVELLQENTQLLQNDTDAKNDRSAR